MEFESLVRRSTLALKTLRGMLAATVVLATTFLAAPAWAQATPETAAPAAPATAAAAAPATGAAAEEAGMSPTAIRNVAIIIALFVVPMSIFTMPSGLIFGVTERFTPTSS